MFQSFCCDFFGIIFFRTSFHHNHQILIQCSQCSQCSKSQKTEKGITFQTKGCDIQLISSVHPMDKKQKTKYQYNDIMEIFKLPEIISNGTRAAWNRGMRLEAVKSKIDAREERSANEMASSSIRIHLV